jgi:hypothetical protein
MYERRAVSVIWTSCLMVTAVALAAQDETAEKKKDAPVVTIEEVAIAPSAPGVETLCQLRVRLKSSAAQTATAFDFGVSIGGSPLEVYEKQLFVDALAPGASHEIRLYNFWTTETGRPAPADGKLRLAVTLRAAQWVEIETEEDGTEVWTLGEPVPGLPSSKELVVELEK